MTALLTAEQLTSGSWTLETELTAGEEVSGISGAVIWLVPGEKMTVSDLLKGLIIGNAGDAAAMLAVGISGDVASFVMEMNARAFDLGMRSTRLMHRRAAMRKRSTPRRRIWHGCAGRCRNMMC